MRRLKAYIIHDFCYKNTEREWCKNGVASVKQGYKNTQNGMYRIIFYICALKGHLNSHNKTNKCTYVKCVHHFLSLS